MRNAASCRSRGNRDAGLVLLRISVALAATAMALLFLMVVAFALPAFVSGGGGGPFSWSWAPGKGEFGILPMAVGSLAVGFSAVIPGWLMGLCLCCWLLCPPRGGRPGCWRVVVGGLVRIMTAVPTVVYGFAAVFLLAPAIRRGFGGSGFSWLTASLMLSVLILPTVVLVLQAGLSERLERAALARRGARHVAHGNHVASGAARLARHPCFPRRCWPSAGPWATPCFRSCWRATRPVAPESMLSSLRTLTAHMRSSRPTRWAARPTIRCSWRDFCCWRSMRWSVSASGVWGRSHETFGSVSLFPRAGADLVRGGSGRGVRAHGISFLARAAVLGPELLFGSTPPLDAVLGRAPVWDGLWPACVGTFWLVELTMALALFPGVGCGVYLAEFASPRKSACSARPWTCLPACRPL